MPSLTPALRRRSCHSRSLHETIPSRLHLRCVHTPYTVMPRLRHAERALTLLTSTPTPTQRHVCLTCRRQALQSRTLHTTPVLRAEESFLSRIRRSVFGSEESKEASRRREEARKKSVQELAETPEQERTGRVYVDPQGREWEVAPLVDESLNPDYVPATTWEGLDRIGSEEWVRRRADSGEVYYGYVRRAQASIYTY